MRVRSLLIVTALLSSLLGAVIVYLVLTVPNDLQASALLKEARKEIAAGKNEEARQSLGRIVQQYPRTDAAAAATVALASIADSERHELEKTVVAMHQAAEAQQKQIAALTQKVDGLAAAPPPAPPPTIAKATPKKAKARTVHHRRRRGRHR